MGFLIALVAGLIFGIGLLLSGMANPDNVLGFLDVAGHWNPALGFVMAGAIAVALPVFARVRHTGRTLRGQAVSLPNRRLITLQLVIGSAIFGIGWGLVGLCPGPALVLAGRGFTYALAFTGAMAVGTILQHLLAGWSADRSTHPSGNSAL